MNIHRFGETGLKKKNWVKPSIADCKMNVIIMSNKNKTENLIKTTLGLYKTK